MTIVLTSLVVGASVARAADTLSIRNLRPPGAFEVENRGPTVTLARPVQVQRELSSGWSDEVTDLELRPNCAQPATGACIPIAGGATLRPPPWNGLTCASQCPAGCRANIHLGPGRFRFVLSSCQSGEKFYGPAFDLPPPK